MNINKILGRLTNLKHVWSFSTLTNDALKYINVKSYEEAIANCNEALELMSYLSDFKPQIAVNAYYHRAIAMKGLKQYENAISDMDKCIKLYPKKEKYFNYRGILKMEAKMYESAKEDLYKCLELNPKYPYPHFNLARVENRSGNYEKAIVICNERIERRPFNPQFYMVRSYSNGKLLNYKEAEADSDIVIKQYSKFAPNAYINRGLAKYNLGKKKEACEDFLKAKELNSIFAEDAIEEFCENNFSSNNHLSSKVEFVDHYSERQIKL